jgi:hypothetical protein
MLFWLMKELQTMASPVMVSSCDGVSISSWETWPETSQVKLDDTRAVVCIFVYC